MYAFSVYQDIDELKQYRGGEGNHDAATIMGIDYPSDESYSVYIWNNSSTVTESLPEVVQPTEGGSIGRWLRVDISSGMPPVNVDWNSTTGLSHILNKPTLSAVASSGAYTDVTGRPSLATVAITGVYSDLSGKPSLATVATSGLYVDLTSKPSLATVATSGGYSDLTGKPNLATVATSGSYTDLTSKPTIPSLTFSSPSSKSISLATAYQATDPSKPTQITLNLTSTSTISLGGTSNNEGEVRIGSANTIAGGTTGTPVGIYRNNLGGTLVIGLTMTTQGCQTVSFVLPVGWYYAVRQTTGSGLSVVSTYEQAIG